MVSRDVIGRTIGVETGDTLDPIDWNRNTTFLREWPAKSRPKRVRDEIVVEVRVRPRSSPPPEPRSLRDKVPPWSTTWIDVRR